MPNTFIVLMDGRPLVVLTEFNTVLPTPQEVLDWYGANFAFDRKRLTGCYLNDYCVKNMQHQDFLNERPK